MKIVLDTNVFLVCISKRSKVHWIFQALINQKFILCVTTDILAEYAEVIEREMSVDASNFALSTLENLPNIERINTWFRFNLLADPDDDKFVDCAIAAGADYIVTEDRDFRPLRHIPFPEVNTLSITKFRAALGADA